MRSRTSKPLLCALVVSVTACGARAQESKVNLITAPDEAVKSISAHEFAEHMHFFASDFLRGRDTTSAEIKIAQEYIAANLRAAGAEPMGDMVDGKRTFFAKFPLERSAPEPDASRLTIIYDKDGAKREEELAYGTAFTVMPFGLSTTSFEAPVVFAGHGISDESIDDYKDLDVKNRIVLVRDGVPEGASGNLGNVFTKFNLAMSRGAYAIVVLKAPGGRSGGAQRIRMGRGGVSLPANNQGIPVITLDEPGIAALKQLAGQDLDALKNGPLEGVKMRISTVSKKETLEDRNVIALFPGTDPDKKKEVIIYSAHLDHDGVNERGEIMNGSDDNASGSTAILEIAEAYGTGPKPARSIAFLWVSGEEKGLLGSRWYSEHSTLPEDYKIVADINLDMVSRNADKEIGITPSPKHPEYNSLVAAGQAACVIEEVTPKFNADEFFGRTDSFNFARHGIPVIFFFSGLHADYHRPTDDVEKADFEKGARIARVAYRLGWHCASEPEIPRKVSADEEPAANAAGN